MKSKPDEKPPWVCRTEQQRQWMRRFVMKGIELKLGERLNRPTTHDFSLIQAAAAAQTNNKLNAILKQRDRNALIDLMESERGRKAVADRLLPIQKRKQARPKIVKSDLTPGELMSMIVDIIRQIWTETYGKVRRAKDNGPFEDDLAADWFVVECHWAPDLGAIKNSKQSEEQKLKLKKALETERKKHGRFKQL